MFSTKFKCHYSVMIQIQFREDNTNIMLDSLYTSILQLLSNIYYFEHELKKKELPKLWTIKLTIFPSFSFGVFQAQINIWSLILKNNVVTWLFPTLILNNNINLPPSLSLSFIKIWPIFQDRESQPIRIGVGRGGGGGVRRWGVAYS